ncbi:hypothetical protein PG988_013657 [Apiospora saccharicola]
MGTLDWGPEYSRTQVEDTNGAPGFQVSEEFRAALQRAGSSSVSATCRADYCLAVGYFFTSTREKGPNLPAILFRLEHKLSQAALVEFKDKFKEKLQKEFNENKNAVFETKVLVAVAQPEKTDHPVTWTDNQVKEDEDIFIDIDGKEVDAAWEILEFHRLGAPIQEERIPRGPPSIHPRGTDGGRAPPQL